MCIRELKLIEPTLELKDEFLAMVEEHLKLDVSADVWDFKEATVDFEAYIKKLQDYAKGDNLPQGWVCASNYWFIDRDNLVIGASGLRHRLTPALRKFGGHIGYFIKPSQRKKGYGSLILEMMLKKAQQLGLRRVLVTCDDNNLASARIIEKHGGVLEDKVMNQGCDVPTRRYWIELK